MINPYRFALTLLVLVSGFVVIHFWTAADWPVEDGPCYDRSGSVIQGVTCDVEVVPWWGFLVMFYVTLSLLGQIILVPWALEMI